MKNAINYYYNLVTYDIRHHGKKYRFKVDNDEYLLVLCEYNLDELEEIYKLDVFLLQMNVYVHQIVLNKDNQIITYINNEPYILMKILVKDTREININDILLFQNLPMYEYFKALRKNNWRDFWIQKIDYFEYQMSELGINFPILRDNFNYFIGITETAISLLYNFNYNSNLIIAHRRVTTNSTLQDLYNPLNLIIDSRIRDVCEYFKSLFFNDTLDLIDIQNYFNITNLTREELYLFYARMLFPSFYFDMYEKIIYGSSEDKELLKITNKIETYQVSGKSFYTLHGPKLSPSQPIWLNEKSLIYFSLQ